jgi:hypothetical protein
MGSKLSNDNYPNKFQNNRGKAFLGQKNRFQPYERYDKKPYQQYQGNKSWYQDYPKGKRGSQNTNHRGNRGKKF